jgi:hypothetical protein
MPSEVTDTRVRRVSFVGRAATRSHLEPDLPQRVLLWKAEDIPDTERTDMTATATAPRTEAEVEQLETEWSDLLTQLSDDLERMRSDDTPPPVVARHERAYGNLHRAMLGLRSPEAATALDARDRARDENTTDGERALFRKCEQLAKADPGLSAAEQVRQAMRDPEILASYYRESGTRPPALPTRRDGLVKSADGYAEHGATVEARADELVKREGLRPSAAYARALRESGVYAAAAA